MEGNAEAANQRTHQLWNPYIIAQREQIDKGEPQKCEEGQQPDDSNRSGVGGDGRCQSVYSIGQERAKEQG